MVGKSNYSGKKSSPAEPRGSVKVTGQQGEPMKAKRQPEKQIRLKKDIVIPAGTILTPGPVSRSYGGGNFEHLIPMGKDHTATLTVYFETDPETADYLEPVNFEPHAIV